MIEFESNLEVTATEDIFDEINKRYVAAMMIHGQMVDYFNFLGLKGYKRLHEYQFLTESLERREICRYFVDHHGKLLKDSFSGTVKVIPDSWYTASRLSIGKSTKQKAVEDGFIEYHNWEKETKEAYEKYAQQLRTNGNVSDALFVECLVKDVSEELEEVEKMVTDLISVGYDMVYITESQECIHDKYKKKLKGVKL